MWLSIIMPIYNSEKTIDRAIKSVLKQKSDDIELLVIDGGSTDQTMNIVDRYRESIEYVVSEKDEGYGDALNKGIKRATGTYIMMLAADDELTPYAIVNAKHSIHNETDVWCGATIEKGELGYRFEKSSPNLEELESHCSLRHPATLFRRALFEKYGYYDTSYKCAADWELFLRLKRAGVNFQMEEIAMVLFAKDGMSNANFELLQRDCDRIMEQYHCDKSANNQKYAFRKVKPKMFWLQKVLYVIGILPYIYRRFGYEEACLTKKMLGEKTRLQ